MHTHTYIHTYRQTDRQTDIHTYIHSYLHTYTHIGSRPRAAANKDLLVRIPQAHIAGRITARRAQPEGHLQNILCPQSALHHPRFGRESRWLAIARPGHQPGDPCELPPHSFSLAEYFYCHFARDPYEIQYLPGQNEVGATAMQWGRNYMVCKSTKWIWTDKVRAGTKCRSTGKGKGQGHGQPRDHGHGKTPRPRRQSGEQLLDSPRWASAAPPDPCPGLVLLLSSVAGLCVQALSSSCPLWLGFVAGPCPPLVLVLLLCGWAVCPGLVLLLSSSCPPPLWLGCVSGSCPPLVLAVAAPLSSVARLCGPACWRGVWPNKWRCQCRQKFIDETGCSWGEAFLD